MRCGSGRSCWWEGGCCRRHAASGGGGGGGVGRMGGGGVGGCQLVVEVGPLSLPCGVSQSEVLGRFYNPNTTPKDKERVVVCLRGTGQELYRKVVVCTGSSL